MPFDRIIDHYVGPWAEWIKDAQFHHKLIAALRLLNHDENRPITFEDLRTRASERGFQRQKHLLSAFYHEAIRQGVGTDGHREWLRAELVKMSPQRLADVIACLPEQSEHMPKPLWLKIMPESFVCNLTHEVNRHLARLNVPTLDGELLVQLCGCMGTHAHGMHL